MNWLTLSQSTKVLPLTFFESDRSFLWPVGSFVVFGKAFEARIVYVFKFLKVSWCYSGDVVDVVWLLIVVITDRRAISKAIYRYFYATECGSFLKTNKKVLLSNKKTKNPDQKQNSIWSVISLFLFFFVTSTYQKIPLLIDLITNLFLTCPC